MKQKRPTAFDVMCLLAMIICILLMFGCVGSLALNRDYADYSEMYGNSINRQLLLNLARLSRDEPPYFIQLGQITASHTFGASAAVSPSTTAEGDHYLTDLTPRMNPTLGSRNTHMFSGSAGVSTTENPSFQFVPLNGDTFTQAITAPISQKVFLTFYDQGYPADELARVMIQSIEKPRESGGSALYVNDPTHPSYPDFLAFCADLRQQQIKGTTYVHKGSPGTSVVFKNTKMADAVSAICAGLNVSNGETSGEYSLSSGGQPELEQVTPAESSSKRHGFGPDLGNVVQFAFYDSGASTTDKEKAVMPPKDHSKPLLHTRTFINVLQAVSKEEGTFASLALRQATEQTKRGNAVSFHCLSDGTAYAILCLGHRSADQSIILPIILVSGPHVRPGTSLDRLIQLNYHDRTYVIGDLEANGIAYDLNEELSRSCGISDAYHSVPSNRRVFTILSYLFTEIAIDPKKLPVQQFIEVR